MNKDESTDKEYWDVVLKAIKNSLEAVFDPNATDYDFERGVFNFNTNVNFLRQARKARFKK